MSESKRGVSKQGVSKQGLSNREQLRLQREAQARRQRTGMRVIYAIAGVVVLAIIATVAIVVVQQSRKNDLAPDPQVKQISAPNLNAAGTAIVQNPQVAGEVPTLTIYLDFQCPHCAAFNATHGDVLNQLAGAGEIRLEYSVTTVIGKAIGNEDASVKAGRAAFCADVAGVFPTYHDALLAGQPEREGDGFTDEQLRVTFANQAGLQDADLTRFQQCYDTRATATALDAEMAAAKPGFGGTTPQVSINGANPTVEKDGQQVPWWADVQPTLGSWQSAIAAHS